MTASGRRWRHSVRGTEADGGWASYVRRFHQERAGITEVVLGGTRPGGDTPYEWAVNLVGGQGPVMDLACGSAPLHRYIAGPLCIGFDSSRAELREAARAGAAPLVLADARNLPLSDGAAAVVLCSMSLQILQPIDHVLTEVARLLRPGGLFVALLPASGPLAVRDRIRYGRLLVALRRPGLAYPNDEALARPVPLFAVHGLDIVSDERRRFGFAVDTPDAGAMFVRSLYLPGESPTRIEAGTRVARRWAGHDLGIPLRRIVATHRG